MADIVVTKTLLDETTAMLKIAVRELTAAAEEMDKLKKDVTLTKATPVGDSMRALSEFVGRLKGEIESLRWEKMYGASQKAKRRTRLERERG